MGRLDNKVAVIVGGGRNIGRASSKLFASEGAKIAIFDMEESRAAAVTEEVAEQGGECMYVVGEVQKVDDVKNMIAKVVDHYGRIDILLNCAAISDRKPMLELDDEDYRKIIEVTQNGTYYTCKYVAEQMVKQGDGGAIVNFSSGSRVQRQPEPRRLRHGEGRHRDAHDGHGGATGEVRHPHERHRAGHHRLAGRRHDRDGGPVDEQPRRRSRGLSGGAGERCPLPRQRRRPPSLRDRPSGTTAAAPSSSPGPFPLDGGGLG